MSDRLGVALFGVGRAGMIHLKNLLSNERAVIWYIVERDLAKARDVIQKYHLKDTIVVSVDDAGKVYQDDRFSDYVLLPLYDGKTSIIFRSYPVSHCPCSFYGQAHTVNVYGRPKICPRYGLVRSVRTVSMVGCTVCTVSCYGLYGDVRSPRKV